MFTKPTHDELVRFVQESNQIEGIDVETDHHLFRHHLKAAERVVDSIRHEQKIDARRIHMALMMSELHDAGQFRSESAQFHDEDTGEMVTVPGPIHVPTLMDEWQMVVDVAFPSGFDLHPDQDKRIAAEFTWDLHHHFLCIHPFTDGNGRVARLILNGFRGKYHLPWVSFLSGNKSQYYKMIRQYEDNVFRPAHPHVYPAAT